MTEFHHILNHQHLDSWYRSKLYKQFVFALDPNMMIEDNKCILYFRICVSATPLLEQD